MVGIILVLVGIGLTVGAMAVGAQQAVNTLGRNQSLLQLSGLPLLLVILGIAFAGIGLLIGASQAFSNDRMAPVQKASAVYVVACIAANELGEHVFEPDMYDPEDIRYYVQVRMADGATREFETAREVVDTLGEGLWGNITYQGRWLSSFERILVDRVRF